MSKSTRLIVIKEAKSQCINLKHSTKNNDLSQLRRQMRMASLASK